MIIKLTIDTWCFSFNGEVASDDVTRQVSVVSCSQHQCIGLVRLEAEVSQLSKQLVGSGHGLPQHNCGSVRLLQTHLQETDTVQWKES